MNHKGGQSEQTRLEALLDKLVAAQLDLEPVYQGKPYPAGDAHGVAIATAYGLLRSAIDDLRQIIHQVGGPIASSAARD
jgi:hypothetical protein